MSDSRRRPLSCGRPADKKKYFADQQTICDHGLIDFNAAEDPSWTDIDRDMEAKQRGAPLSSPARLLSADPP